MQIQNFGKIIWVLVGKADIVKKAAVREKLPLGQGAFAEEAHLYRDEFCIMNFTFDTSERTGELNHPWHITPPTPYFPEGIDFSFEHLYKGKN